MSKDFKIGKRITDLRKSQGMNQVQFAEALGVSQGLLSEWESGVSIPSAPGYVKLAVQAVKSNPTEALFFWAESGISPEALVSIADMFLGKGEVKMDSVLATAERILKERILDPKPLEDEGKVVLVPPFTEGAWETQRSAPAIPMPAYRFPNKTSSYYIMVPYEHHQLGQRHSLIPGEIIAFDAVESSSQLFGAVLGQLVFVHFSGPNPLLNPECGWKYLAFAEIAERVPRAAYWPQGLFVGRAGIRRAGLINWVVLGPRDKGSDTWSHEDLVYLDVFEFKHHVVGKPPPEGIPYAAPDHAVGKPPPEGTPSGAHKRYSETVRGLIFPPRCRLLGRVIGQFPPEFHELWKGQWEQPKE